MDDMIGAGAAASASEPLRPKRQTYETPSAEMLEAIRSEIRAGKSAREIGAAMGLPNKVIIRWASKHGLGPWATAPGPVSGLTIADGFQAFYAEHTQLETAQHFGVAPSTISKWAKHLGIKRYRPAAPVEQRPVQRRPARRSFRQAISASPSGNISPTRVHLDASPASLAAEFLRRFGEVVRCNPKGDYDAKGTHWRRNRAVLTADEVMQRAARLGWSNPYRIAS